MSDDSIRIMASPRPIGVNFPRGEVGFGILGWRGYLCSGLLVVIRVHFNVTVECHCTRNDYNQVLVYNQRRIPVPVTPYPVPVPGVCGTLTSSWYCFARGARVWSR